MTTPIETLYHEWQDYRQNAWKKNPNTEALVNGLTALEDKIASEPPTSREDAQILLRFFHQLWWENIDHSPLEGRLFTMATVFDNGLRYLKNELISHSRN